MSAVHAELHRLETADGARVSGALRLPSGGTDTVLSIMHPREDVMHHPLVDLLVESGFAVWSQNTRSVNNDVRLLHEQALLDVAAGQAFLADRGFDARVTVGHSGGATLFALYQQQANLPAEERLTHTPDGRPVDLRSATMPSPDGAIFMAPHPGQGVLLQRVIDPSVVDEADPWTAVPELDPYNNRNGYHPAPESSAYSPEFVAAYRDAQRERVLRIDAAAAAAVEAAAAARDAAKGSGDPAYCRRAKAADVMVVHRTDADLRSVDLSVDPNERPYGSLFGPRPDLSNYGFAGFCRITTPAAWISTWSATTSRANFVDNARGVTSPSLLVELTGDQACFPVDARDMYSALATRDKKHVKVRGTHFGGPIAPGEPTGAELAARQMRRWLLERFDT